MIETSINNSPFVEDGRARDVLRTPVDGLDSSKTSILSSIYYATVGTISIGFIFFFGMMLHGRTLISLRPGELRAIPNTMTLFRRELVVAHATPSVKVYKETGGPPKLINSNKATIISKHKLLLSNQMIDYSHYMNRGSAFSVSLSSKTGAVDIYVFKGDNAFENWSNRISKTWLFHQNGSTSKPVWNKIDSSDQIHVVFLNKEKHDTDINFNITVHHTEYAFDEKSTVCESTQTHCLIKLRYYALYRLLI